MNRLIGYSACASLMLTVCVGPCLPLFDAGWLAAVTLVFTIVAGCTAWQTPPGRIAAICGLIIAGAGIAVYLVMLIWTLRWLSTSD
jgi:hypothetical protein